MTLLSVNELDKIGVIYDVHAAELPAQAFTEGRNVRFADGSVQSRFKDRALGPGTPFVWAFPTARTITGEATWIAISNNNAYTYQSDTFTSILGPAIVQPERGRWNGGLLGGVAVLNSGNGTPQVWMDTPPTTPLIPLPNWPTGYKCASMRVYKNYLVAMDVTRNGRRQQSTLLWSHPADPGTVPISWNIADTTRDAGDVSLSETPGAIIDLCTLKDTAIIYKEDSVWGMQWIGGTYIFRFYKIFSDFGVANRDCVVEYLPGIHAVFTGTDFIRHNGQSYTSVVDGRMRSLFRSFTPATLQSAFLCTMAQFSEVWLCWATQPYENPLEVDQALVWNWANETLVLLDLQPGTTWAVAGLIADPLVISNTWDAATEEWGLAYPNWGLPLQAAGSIGLVGCGPQGIFRIEGGDTTRTGYVERKDYGIPHLTDKPPDMSIRKFLSRVYPRFTGAVGNQFAVSLGVSDILDTPPVFQPQPMFQIDVHLSLPVIMTGRLLHLRVDFAEMQPWKFNGFDLEVRAAGRWIDGLL
jgi:hypothetical protein